MHFPSDWHDRIEAEDGAIIRIVNAEWIDKRNGGKFYSVDVYKENDAGEAWSQNLYQSMWGGSCVMFPGLPRNVNSNSWYYDESIAEEEGWYSRSLSTVGWSDNITETEKELIISFYPDFKYVFKKHEMTSKREVMKILRVWIEHHEAELVLAIGFEKVALNGNFWRLSEKNRKETSLFMRQNQQFKDLTFREIREAMKARNPVEYADYLAKVPSYRRCARGSYYESFTYEDFKYCKKTLKKFHSSYSDDERALCELINFYGDYLYMLKRSEHNNKDKYWRYPSDVETFHNRLVEEERIKREAQRLEEERRRAEADRRRALEDAKRIKVMKQIEKKFKELNGTIDGFSIFVTSNYDEWQKQAKALSQCICACGYYQQMADGKCSIVFIQKDGIPQATAEVRPDGSIGQFYADERDRNNCLPSPEIKAAFNKWLDTVPKSKFKKAKTRQRKSVKKEVAA